MTPHRPLIRWWLLLLVVAVMAGGCTSGGGLGDLGSDGEPPSQDGPIGVEPPPDADPTLTGRVGLVVATNSATWPKMMDVAPGLGVVVLFVQPDGPSDGAVERGDVITEVDGEPARNAERAVFQLRAKPDETKRLRVVGPDGAEREVAVTAEVPGDVSLKSLYDPRVEENPDDAVLRFLRAQAVSGFDAAMADVQRAIDLQPAFVEALSLRGELRWNQARDADLTPEQVQELRDQALQDWNLALRLDPLNTRVLVSRAHAQVQLGNANAAKRDGQKAKAEDPTFPGAHYAIAISDFLLGRYRTAAEPARLAIELNPYDVRYYDLLARIFARTGNTEEAEQTVEAIIDLVPDGPTKTRLRRIPDEASDGS